MSETNVAISETTCSFTLGRRHCRQHVYDKFLETERRRFRMCLNVFNLFFARTRISLNYKKILLNFFEI